MEFKNPARLAAVCSALFASFILHSQSSENIYTWFDSQTGSSSATIYNGPIYLYQYRSKERKNTPFLDDDVFVSGDVAYNGQLYYNQSIKYDISRDILVLRPADNAEPIALIQQKTAAFKIGDRTFVNLNDGVHLGYFEENLKGENFTFYIKHHKDVREIINGEALYNDFMTTNSYLVFYKNNFFDVRSRKSITTVFPEFKTEIAKYFSAHKRVSNQTEFLEGLFKFLNTIVK